MFDIVHWAASAAGFLVAARRSRVAIGSSSDAGEVSGDHGVLQCPNRARDSRTDMTNYSTAIARQ